MRTQIILRADSRLPCGIIFCRRFSAEPRQLSINDSGDVRTKPFAFTNRRNLLQVAGVTR
jgi:hypothetical protein